MNIAHIVQSRVLRATRHQQNRTSRYRTCGVWRHRDPDFAFPVVEDCIERKVRQAARRITPSVVDRPVRERIRRTLWIGAIASHFRHGLTRERESEEGRMLVDGALA